MRTMLKFVHKNILTHFGAPRVIVSDEGTHFYNKLLANLMVKYGAKHRKALAYHSQLNGQVEIIN